MAKGKQVAKAPKAAKKASNTKDWKSQHGHLFTKDARDYGIGRDILPKKRDLSRMVRWPRYIRLQRQKAILYKRLKIPPSINQFSKTLDKNQATNLFRLLSNYRPESPTEKKERLRSVAAAEAKSQDVKSGSKPVEVKYGLNHVTELIESKKAKLVVIAHDVDPIELVVWLPALCRKMDVPYCIVKGKARLGEVVYKKTATCLAVTSCKREDQKDLDVLCESFTAAFNNNKDVQRKWGGGIMGVKSQHVEKAK